MIETQDNVKQSKQMGRRPYETWAVAAVTLLGFFGRVARLDLAPPAFSYAESARAVGALDVMQGYTGVMAEHLRGVTTFFLFLTGGAFSLLGTRVASQRLLVAFLSALAIPLLYTLARWMFRPLGERRAGLIGVLAALGLATSYSYLHFSRTGLETGLIPFVMLLVVALGWRGLETRGAGYFVLSGACFGLGLYLDPVFRFLPALIAAFVLSRVLTRRPDLTLTPTLSLQGRGGDVLPPNTGRGGQTLTPALSLEGRGSDNPPPNTGGGGETLTPALSLQGRGSDSPPPVHGGRWRGVVALLAFVLGFAIVYAPLAEYWAGHPGDFLRRGTESFFLRPEVHQGDPLGTLARGLQGSLLTFGRRGDLSAAANLPGRPFLDPAMAALFWGGLALSLYHFRRAGYALCALWWGVMLLPAVLTPDRVPDHARLMALAPVVYIFPALAAEALWQKAVGQVLIPAAPPAAMESRPTNQPEISEMSGRRVLLVPAALCGILLLVYGWTAFSTCRDYFGRWAGSEAAYLAFNGPDRELAERINAGELDTAYLFPYDVLWSPQPYAVARFFHAGGADYQTVHVNELQVPRQLNQATQGKSRAKVVRMAQGQEEFLAANADPKDLLGFYLEQHGQRVGTETYAGGEIHEYVLPPDGVDFARPLQFLGYGVAYDRQLWLESSALGNASHPGFDDDGEIRPGDTLWLIVQWDILNPNTEDYAAHLRLLDENGDVVVQVEHLLLDNLHQPSGRWPKRDIPTLDFVLFPLPADLPPGEYTLAAGVYIPASGEYMPIHATDGEIFFEMRRVEVVGE